MAARPVCARRADACIDPFRVGPDLPAWHMRGV